MANPYRSTEYLPDILHLHVVKIFLTTKLNEVEPFRASHPRSAIGKEGKGWLMDNPIFKCMDLDRLPLLMNLWCLSNCATSGLLDATLLIDNRVGWRVNDTDQQWQDPEERTPILRFAIVDLMGRSQYR